MLWVAVCARGGKGMMASRVQGGAMAVVALCVLGGQWYGGRVCVQGGGNAKVAVCARGGNAVVAVCVRRGNGMVTSCMQGGAMLWWPCV